MATYPATAHGAVCQFPVEKEQQWRIVEIESGGGIRERRTERGAIVRWRLRYEDLSDAEGLALEQFYADRGGALKPFEFVDPFANTILDSADLTTAAWSRNGGSVGQSDEVRDGHRVFLLTGGCELSQNVEVAGGYAYCASAWARSPGGGELQIDLAGNQNTIPLGPNWRRCWVSMAPAGATGVVGVTFVNAGPSETEIAALSLVAQPYPGEATVSGAGRSLYRSAHFAEGGFRLIPTGPNRNRVEVTIEAVIEDES